MSAPSHVSMLSIFMTPQQVYEPSISRCAQESVSHLALSCSLHWNYIYSSAPAAANETFYLRINGQPLFARGANLIPLHPLHAGGGAGQGQEGRDGPAGPAAMARVLAAALAANMNMIRVW